MEAPQAGFLLCQDTYFAGTIKGVGKIHMQSVLDAHCSLAFAKLYLSKLPMTAVDVLHDRVLLFYEEQRVEVERVLTDNGREYCGRPLAHPYEPFLAIPQGGIDHRRTDVASPESNGLCERFHRTLTEEFLQVALLTENPSREPGPVTGGPGSLHGVLQPGARPSGLSHPRAHYPSRVPGGRERDPRSRVSRPAARVKLAARSPGRFAPQGGDRLS